MVQGLVGVGVPSLPETGPTALAKHMCACGSAFCEGLPKAVMTCAWALWRPTISSRSWSVIRYRWHVHLQAARPGPQTCPPSFPWADPSLPMPAAMALACTTNHPISAGLYMRSCKACKAWGPVGGGRPRLCRPPRHHAPPPLTEAERLSAVDVLLVWSLLPLRPAGVAGVGQRRARAAALVLLCFLLLVGVAPS